MTIPTMPKDELTLEINLRNISWQLSELRKRLDLLRFESKRGIRELAAAKTGLIVAESAIESLLQ